MQGLMYMYALQLRCAGWTIIPFTRVCADHYNKPSMAAFASPALLCEGYALDTGGSSYTAVQCPFPATLNRSTADQWEANTAGSRCDSNNDTECAASGTPLTTSIADSVLQTLALAITDQTLIGSAESFASCDTTLDTMRALEGYQCGGPDLRVRLLVAWIALTAGGGAAALLSVALLLLRKTRRLTSLLPPMRVRSWCAPGRNFQCCSSAQAPGAAAAFAS